MTLETTVAAEGSQAFFNDYLHPQLPPASEYPGPYLIFALPNQANHTNR
jgi:hypothetical protein